MYHKQVMNGAQVSVVGKKHWKQTIWEVSNATDVTPELKIVDQFLQ